MVENLYRYKYAPQMREYHNMGKSILPYIMFSNNINKRMVLLIQILMDFVLIFLIKFRTIYDQVENKKNLCAVMGGSSAFGAGATNDDKTIASLLTNNDSFYYNLHKGQRAQSRYYYL